MADEYEDRAVVGVKITLEGAVDAVKTPTASVRLDCRVLLSLEPTDGASEGPTVRFALDVAPMPEARFQDVEVAALAAAVALIRRLAKEDVESLLRARQAGVDDALTPWDTSSFYKP